jgi:hypothetical protein
MNPSSGSYYARVIKWEKGNIEKLIASGSENLIEICQKSGAGLGCGAVSPKFNTSSAGAQ